MKRVLISTIYEGDRVPFLVRSLEPDRIIFIMDENETRKKSYDKFEKIFKDKGTKVEEIRLEKTHSIYDMTKQIYEKMNELRRGGFTIQIGICEGKKPMALAAMYASYLEHKSIEGIYYILHETAELVNYPLLNFKITNGRKEILEIIKKGIEEGENVSTSYMIKKANKTPSSVYENISNLTQGGFIEEEKEKNTFKLTDFGKIVLLN